ncbi:MAG: hypothetical protein JSW61_10950 [Candidatus Thorarchaeota archaeon]|nr:MAG: hypothetical protein JSW61_10950 [Candidatus Thorarchaeota archaeon]
MDSNEDVLDRIKALRTNGELAEAERLVKVKIENVRYLLPFQCFTRQGET